MTPKGLLEITDGVPEFVKDKDGNIINGNIIKMHLMMNRVISDMSI